MRVIKDTIIIALLDTITAHRAEIYDIAARYGVEIFVFLVQWHVGKSGKIVMWIF